MDQTEYRIYKGLQKPLVLVGLKGANIIWAAATFITAFLTFTVTFALSDTLTATVVTLLPVSYGAYKIIYKMKYGLHEKKRHKDVLVAKNLISRF